MKILPVSLTLAVIALPALAVNFGEKPNTPQIPGSKYVVHDGTRPQPRIIDNAGAVVVKPPADAIVLFDGTSLDAWKSGNDKAAFKLVDGVMVAHGSGVQTKQSFGDVQMHFEWRLPADRKVNGQKGGNSGCFFMGRYEVQVLQSHNNKTYPDGQAGAMYGQTPPLVNATTKQGDWQSYDIVFIAPKYKDGKLLSPAKLTIFHNGVLLHNAHPYMGPTKHKKATSYPETHPEKGPISLQWHSDPIEYRNIWVRELGSYDDGTPVEAKK